MLFTTILRITQEMLTLKCSKDLKNSAMIQTSCTKSTIAHLPINRLLGARFILTGAIKSLVTMTFVVLTVQMPKENVAITLVITPQ
jgi:hypothetical protein